MKLTIRDKYNFKGQLERLFFIGKDGAWNQFEKEGERGVVWAEAPDWGLGLMEKPE